MGSILITGNHGFVGSNLTTALKEHHRIYGLDIDSSQKAGVIKTFGWNELEQIPPVDLIIHLAGKAHDTGNKSSGKDYFDINVGLTEKIFQYFLTSHSTKFIFFSSVKAIADTVSGDFLTEDDVSDPQTEYGRSKLAAEHYLLNQLRQSNKKLYILRPCMIHGPGNKGNLNLLYQIVNKGIPWPLGSFANKRSFTAIDNLSFIINRFMEQDIEPGIYQVADDESIGTNDLIRMISQSKGGKAKIWHINMGLIRLAARIGDILHLPLNSERLKKLTDSYIVSNEKLKGALGIQRMPLTAKEGMSKTIDSFRTR